ncbi:ATP-binding protein [Pedobacter deserti]|uniref:ATP-binding protein n=1 Tax=Pedobacter deserti TaxID=2817382 RepID=UPI00210D6DCF|nr:ATP-binding protein [Pedobacter sp. SYSU D00382]
MPHEKSRRTRTLTLCYFLVSLGLMCLASCQSNSENQRINDPKRADSLIQRADDLINAGEIDRSLRYLDSSYAKFNNAGRIDNWKRYRHLCYFYINYKFSAQKANLYVDSMFRVLKGLEDDHKNEYAHSMFSRGDVLRAQNHYNEAFYKYYEGRQYALQNLDTCDLGSFTNRLGLIRYAQQDFLKAVSYFKQAQAELSHCQDSSSTFETSFMLPQSIYNNIAFSYEQAGKADSALIYYRIGLEYIEREQPKYPDRKAYIESAVGVFCGNLGGQYALIGKTAEAEKYLKRSIALNDREGYAREDATTAKTKLAVLYIKQSKLDAARQWIESIEGDLAREQGSNHQQQVRYRNVVKLKAEYYQKAGNLQKALAYMTESAALRDSAWNAEKKMRSIDMDATFREAEQAHQLELAEKNSQIKTSYLAAAIVFSIITIAFLLVMWFNLRRTRNHLKELRILNKKVTQQNGQLSNTLRLLRQSQEENTRLTRVVAHDLRSPIGAIFMGCSLIMHKDCPNAEDIELIEMMKKSASDCLALVDDILQPKNENGKLQKQAENLHEILRFCTDQLRSKAAQKQQTLTFEGIDIRAQVNAEKLWRVMTNLIGNAIKFSPENSEIRVNLTKSGEQALITVADNGIGIPEELRDKIFSAPAEASRRGTAGEETFGLGLAISRQIVLAHNGKIWFDTIPGKGTTFYIELPTGIDDFTADSI